MWKVGVTVTSPARTNYRYRYNLPEDTQAPDNIFLTDTPNQNPFFVVPPGYTLDRTFMQGIFNFGYYITGMDAPYANPWWTDWGPWIGLAMTGGTPTAPVPTPIDRISGDDQPWVQSNPLVLNSVERGDSENGPFEIAHFYIAQDVQQTRANRFSSPDNEETFVWLCWNANHFAIPPYEVPDTSNYQGFVQCSIDVTLFFEQPAS